MTGSLINSSVIQDKNIELMVEQYVKGLAENRRKMEKSNWFAL